MCLAAHEPVVNSRLAVRMPRIRLHRAMCDRGEQCSFFSLRFGTDMLTVLILLAYLVVTQNRALRLNPDRILALSWLMLVAAYLLVADDYVELTDEFQFLVVSFVLAFGVAYQIIQRLPRVTRSVRPPLSISPKAAVMLAIPIASLPIVLAAKNVMSGSVASLVDLRTFILGDVDTDRPFTGIGYAFPIACAGWYFARRNQLRGLTWVSGSLVLATAILSTSKIFLFLFLFYLVPLWKKDLQLRKWMLGFTTLGLGAFAASHILLEKLASDADEAGVLMAVWQTFRVYLLGGIAALQNAITGVTELPHGLMWRPVDKVLPGVFDVPATDQSPWSNFGGGIGNVYTAFANWRDQFGLASGVLMGCLLGAFYAHVFCRLRACVAVDFYRTFLMFPLLFMFFSDFYVAGLYMHIGFAFAAYLLSRVQPEDGGHQQFPQKA